MRGPMAGFSQSAGQLIAARAFQGLGMGGIQALVQVAIAAMIPPRERGRYNGYLGGVLALATVGGPLLGGLIVDTSWLGWRWCFFIGAPIAVLALILLQKTLHLPLIRRANVQIDYWGATLMAVGASIILGFVRRQLVRLALLADVRHGRRRRGAAAHRGVGRDARGRAGGPAADRPPAHLGPRHPGQPR